MQNAMGKDMTRYFPRSFELNIVVNSCRCTSTVAWNIEYSSMKRGKHTHAHKTGTILSVGSTRDVCGGKSDDEGRHQTVRGQRRGENYVSSRARVCGVKVSL